MFEVIEPSTVPKGTHILYHKWVETPEKARLTAADKKEYGAADDLVHCPTPSAATNAAIEILATVKGYCFRCFDVTSAFPHADVVNPWVVMFPPKEWIRMGPERENKRWRMKKALYGRRPAAANFRDFFEDCVGQIQFTRGSTEPCAYYNKEWDTVITHHIDDGRIVGPEKYVIKTIEFLRKKMLLKVSSAIQVGMAVEHLHRLKIRLGNGWRTQPNPKHAQSIIDLVLEGKVIGKAIGTPGVRRGSRVGSDFAPIRVERAAIFRSAVGA